VKVLVLGGAGAVGVVYGSHLARGGAEVSVYVRPSRVEEAQRGWDLHKVSLLGRRASQRWTPSAALTKVEGRFDQVWIATPSDALFEPWLPEALAACGEALVVCLQPGRAAAERMMDLVPAARLVHGAIPFISWRTPLSGSSDARELKCSPGYAYFLPGPGGFEGSRASEVIGALKAGAFRARRAKVDESLAMTSSVLLPHVVALERAGWSFDTLRTSALSQLAVDASHEAAVIAARQLGLRVPLAFRLVATPFTRLAMRLVQSRLTPFDVPAYFRVHFTKVRTQTLQILSEMIIDGTRHGLPVTALSQLQAGSR
jgi:2-dehydropantoate 2-reductase